MVLPGAHDGPLYNQYNAAGDWIGCLNPEDVEKLDEDKAVSLEGPAGSLTIHNCRMPHASLPNNSDLGRPLLLNIYSAAERDKIQIRSENCPWSVGTLGPSRSTPLSASTGLVKRLFLDFRPAAGRRLGRPRHQVIRLLFGDLIFAAMVGGMRKDMAADNSELEEFQGVDKNRISDVCLIYQISCSALITFGPPVH